MLFFIQLYGIKVKFTNSIWTDTENLPGTGLFLWHLAVEKQRYEFTQERLHRAEGRL